LGYDPQNLNNAQISKIVSDFVKAAEGVNALPPSDSAIARRDESSPDVAGSSTPATGRSRRGSGRKQPLDISELVVRAAGEANANIESTKAPIIAGIEKWTEHEADSVFQIFEDAPAVFIEKLADKLEGHRANPEYFRGLGKKFAAGIFNFIPDDEADTVA
jgi:hypothetical protein